MSQISLAILARKTCVVVLTLNMKKIQLTKNKFALVDDDMFEYLNQFRWHYNKGRGVGRAQRSTSRKDPGGKTSIFMHRSIMNVPKDMQIDHINGNGLDNRIVNLRVCTNVENNRNKNVIKRNTSGITGVSWNKNYQKWHTYIKSNYQHIFLGYFSDKKDAIKVRKQAEEKYFGEFAYKGGALT